MYSWFSAGRSGFFIWTVSPFFGLALTYAILAPPEYTSQARVVREVPEDGILPH